MNPTHLNEFWLNLQLELSGWGWRVVLEVWEVGNPHLVKDFVKVGIDLVWFDKLVMTNNGREESESKMREWVKEKVKVKGDWKGKWWRKAALTPQPTCNRIWHIFCLEKHSKTLIKNTAMDNLCWADNKQPTHWRWVRNPMRWKGARTRVSMVRSNSDLTSVDWYFLTGKMREIMYWGTMSKLGRAFKLSEGFWKTITCI